MKTGQLIRELRLKKGITQEELAARTEISVRTIQRIESGEVDPRAYTLQSIAQALEVDFGILANRASESSESAEKENSKWLPIIHLSGILLLIVPTLILWIWKRSQVPTIRKHAIDSLNFQLSFSLYLLPCLLASAYPIVVIIAVYSQIMIIVNTVKVTGLEDYSYPLKIRFLK